MSDQQSLTITVTPREVDALKSLRAFVGKHDWPVPICENWLPDQDTFALDRIIAATMLSPDHRRKLLEVRRFIDALDCRQWIERKSLLLAIDEVLA